MSSFKIERWEWKFVVWVVVAILVLTSIPYVFAAEIPIRENNLWGLS